VQTIAATAGLQASWEVLNDFKRRGTAALDDWAKRSAESQYGRPGQADLTRTAAVRRIEDEFLPADLQRDYDRTWGHGASFGPRVPQ
jgi:hypothetical protein